MEIKIWGYELREMIKSHMEISYGLDMESKEIDIQDMGFAYTERDIVFKKHKNGKIKKCKDGYSIIDEEKSKYVTKYADLNDDSELSIVVY